MLTILFDGVAYGMLLFVLACGLAVTLGLMNFVNLAHGAFAMAGGYVTAVLMNRYGVPFLPTLPLAFLGPAAPRLVLEQTLYRHLYGRTHLDQVLFSIGLVFMAVAAVDYTMGSQQQLIQLPGWLQGRVDILGVQVGLYRSFIIAVCGILVVTIAAHLDQNPVRQPAAGRRRRSAGRQRTWHQCRRYLRNDVRGRLRSRRIGRSARGGDPRSRPDFSAQVHDLLPHRRDGRRDERHHWTFLASLVLGIADVAGKYYVPEIGAFVIYTLMIVILVLRPQGLFARAR